MTPTGSTRSTPTLSRLARDTGYFTYLAGLQANIEVVLGDARMSLERELRAGQQQFDVMVLDAFSGDAIPAHLLTREAFDLYLQHLRDPDGVIAINVTNRVLDLKPLVWGLAESLGLAVVLVGSPGDKTMTFPAEWMLLTHDLAFLERPEIASAGSFYHAPISIGVWTDDYHPLLPIMK